MYFFNIFLYLILLRETHEQILPPVDKNNLFGHQNFDARNNFPTAPKDPVVGMGLGLPMLRAATIVPRAKIGAMNSLAQAYAFALKARADAQHRIIDNQLRYELAAARARIPGLSGLHRPLPLSPRFRLPGNPILGSENPNIDGEDSNANTEDDFFNNDGEKSFDFDNGASTFQLGDEFLNDPSSVFPNNQNLDGEFGMDQDSLNAMTKDLQSLLNGGGLFDRNMDRRHAYDYRIPENFQYQDERRDISPENIMGSDTHKMFRREVTEIGKADTKTSTTTKNYLSVNDELDYSTNRKYNRFRKNPKDLDNAVVKNAYSAIKITPVQGILGGDFSKNNVDHIMSRRFVNNLKIPEVNNTPIYTSITENEIEEKINENVDLPIMEKTHQKNDSAEFKPTENLIKLALNSTIDSINSILNATISEQNIIAPNLTKQTDTNTKFNNTLLEDILNEEEKADHQDLRLLHEKGENHNNSLILPMDLKEEPEKYQNLNKLQSIIQNTAEYKNNQTKKLILNSNQNINTYIDDNVDIKSETFKPIQGINTIPIDVSKTVQIGDSGEVNENNGSHEANDNHSQVQESNPKLDGSTNQNTNPSITSQLELALEEQEKPHTIKARHAEMQNMKRDEELFIWSLNNFNAGNNLMRDVESQNPCNDLFEIRGNPNFWDNYDILCGTNHHPAPLEQVRYTPVIPLNGGSAFEKDKETIVKHEIVDPKSKINKMEPRHFDLFGKHKGPLFHSHHSIFNKDTKHMGGNFHQNFDSHFSQGFSHFGDNQNKFHSHEINKFNKPHPPHMMINNHQTNQQFLNHPTNQQLLNHQNFLNQQTNQQFVHGKTFQTQVIPQTTPTHVTINNHQNTFTNAISANGLHDLKITQAGGAVAESQATNTNINQFLRSSNHYENPYLQTRPMESSNLQEQDQNKVIDMNMPHSDDLTYKDQHHSEVGNGITHNEVDSKNFQLSVQNNYHNRNFANNQVEGSPNSNNPTYGYQQSEVLKSPYLLRFPYQRVSFHKRNSQHLRSKRSLPLVRLIADPNTKLDMPKTLENVGTIAKKSFEDKRAPMYHVKNMIGSTKDAFMSTLKIAPQDIIIPSRYRIIDTKEEIVMKPGEIQAIKDEARAAAEREFRENQIVGSSAPQPQILNFNKRNALKDFFDKFRLKNDIFAKPKIDEGLFRKAAFTPPKLPEPRLSIPSQEPEEDPFNFLGTFQKVGSAIRDSIKSSHETVSHINNVAHSARKAFTTSKFALPRVLLPYSRAPVVKSTLFDDNLMLISPRFLDVAEEDVNKHDHSDSYVKMGEIMDAFGMSKPGDERVGLSRIIIQKKKDNPVVQSRFGGDESENVGIPGREYYLISESVDDPNSVESIAVEAFKSLHDIKEMIGASTFKDFLEEMKREFHTLRSVKLDSRMSTNKSTDDEELNQFLQDLFKNNTQETISSRMGDDSREELVGAGMNLPKNLFKPFMNQPTRTELEDYFHAHGDDLNDIELPENGDELQQFLKLTGLVSSINPDIYMRLFNESLSINKNSTVLDPAGLFKVDEKDATLKSTNDRAVDEEDQRAMMEIHKKLLKPYMGKIKIKKGGGDYEDYGQPYESYFGGFDDEEDGDGIL